MPRKPESEVQRRPCGCLASQSHRPACPLNAGHGGNRQGKPKGKRIHLTVDEAAYAAWEAFKGGRPPQEAGQELFSAFFGLQR